MAIAATPGRPYNEELPTTIIELVEVALESASYPRHTLDASSKLECSGYNVFPLFADAGGMRDGIAVVEHISARDESLRYVQEYLAALQANPYCAMLRMRMVRVGFSPAQLQLWVWRELQAFPLITD